MELTSRIFVTTSPINVVFYLLYIQSKKNERFNDVLIICNGHMNPSSYEKLSLLVAQHNWSQVITTNDILSTAPQQQVSFKKRIIRKVRKFKLFQPFYNYSRAIYEKKEKSRTINWLKTQLKVSNESPVELNLLTETSINAALFELYPNAKTNYFEHGLSDYIMIENSTKPSNFYCLFNEEFQSYLTNKQVDRHSVVPVYQHDHFNSIASNYLAPLMNEFNEVFKNSNTSTNYVLILMQDFENLGISSNIHTQLFSKILHYLGEKSTNSTFLIKPHPKQSLKSMKEMEVFFIQAQLNFSFLNAPCFQYTSIELFFYLMKDATSHVFSYYSSGLFYLSKLYPDSKIEYLYTLDPIASEIVHMPLEVGKIHSAFIQQQKQLFVKNCIEF